MKKLLLSISIAVAMAVTFSFMPEAKADGICCCSEWNSVYTYYTENGRPCQIWVRTCQGPEGDVTQVYETCGGIE